MSNVSEFSEALNSGEWIEITHVTDPNTPGEASDPLGKVHRPGHNVDQEIQDHGRLSEDHLECQRCEEESLGSKYQCAACGYRPRLEAAMAGVACGTCGVSMSLLGIALGALILPLILVPVGVLLGVVGLLFLIVAPIVRIDQADMFPEPHAPTGSRP